MAKTFQDAAAANAVSPASGVKRERSGDEEQTRHVSPRTQEENDDEVESVLEKILLRTLRSDDDAVLANAVEELYYEMIDGTLAAKQKEFYQLGGHATTVRVMNERLASKSIQDYGIAVLRKACDKNDELKNAIARVKGIQAILEAMEKHERVLVWEGFGALWNLVVENEGNAELLVKKLDAMPFLVKMMNSYISDKDITERACGLLEALCGFKNLKKQIVSAKAKTALATAMDKHEEHAEIQEHAGAAMKLLL